MTFKKNLIISYILAQWLDKGSKKFYEENLEDVFQQNRRVVWGKGRYRIQTAMWFM